MLLIYDICRYQKAWYLEQISPWCAAFTSENLKVLNKPKCYRWIDSLTFISLLIQGSGIRRGLGNVSQTRLRSRTQLSSSLSFGRRFGNTNQVCCTHMISRFSLEIIVKYLNGVDFGDDAERSELITERRINKEACSTLPKERGYFVSWPAWD